MQERSAEVQAALNRAVLIHYWARAIQRQQAAPTQSRFSTFWNAMACRSNCSAVAAAHLSIQHVSAEQCLPSFSAPGLLKWEAMTLLPALNRVVSYTTNTSILLRHLESIHDTTCLISCDRILILILLSCCSINWITGKCFKFSWRE